MRTTIDLLLDDLVNAQRALTRALARQDEERRKVQHPRREAALQAVRDYVIGKETELARVATEAHRLANEVMQIRYVMQLVRVAVPEVVSEAEAKASAVVRVPDAALRSFSAALADAVRNGHAQRLRGDVVITYAGLLELARAKDTRERFEELRTSQFELERRLHAITGTAEAKSA